MRVLVSGANGFIGQAVCQALSNSGCNHEIRGAIRKGALHGIASVEVGDIGPETDWFAALQSVDIVVHLAARVHVMRETAMDALAEFRKTNTAGTETLAKAAARMGVRRFIYISSIKVNGEETLGASFKETDLPGPTDPYAISKYEAEQLLWQIGNEMGMEIVILRPPLIYGPGVRANFLRLMGSVVRGVPLPLAKVKNVRSLLYLGNLVDAIVVSVDHPAAAGKVFLLSDGEDISTPTLIRKIGRALGCPARLWPVPVMILQLVGKLTGKSAEVERLLGSLAVDSSRIRHDLGWHPPFTLNEGLQLTAQWYLAEKQDLGKT